MKAFAKTFKRTAGIVLAAIYTVMTVCIPVCGNAAESRHVRIPCGINGLLYLDEKGEPAGYCAEYLKALADTNDWVFDYVETTWTEAVEMLENGGIDILFPTNYTPQREADMDFSSLIGGYTAAGLFASADSAYSYEDFANWDGVRIAVTKGTSNETELAEYAAGKGFSYEPVFIDAMEKKIEAVENGDADMMIFSASNEVPNSVIVSVLDANAFYYAVKEDNDELLGELNHGMQHLQTHHPELVSETSLKCILGDNAASLALTSAEREFLRSEEEIVVGFYVDTEPLAYVNDDGAYCGVYPEIMEHLRETSGLNITLKPLTRDVSWKDLIKSGDIDFYIGASATIASNDEHMICTDTFLEYVTVLITNKDTNFMRLKHPTVALTNGRKYWVDHLPKSLGNVDIKFYESAKDCLIAVQKGDADATLINNYEYNYHSKNSRFASLITWENFRFVGEGGLTAAAALSPVKFSAMNKAIDKLTTEYVSEVVSRNLNMSYRSSFIDVLYAGRNVIIVGGLCLFFITVIAVAIAVIRGRQRKVLNEAREKEAEQLRILAALSADYDVVYYTDLTADKCRVVRVDTEKTTLASLSSLHSEALREYIENKVVPEYRDKLTAYTDGAEIIRIFDEAGDFSLRYRVYPESGGREHFEMHFVDAGLNDEHRTMVFGIRCVDAAAKEEKARQQLLRDALEAANRANSAKSDFLSKMSHDMRTPLNGIIGMTAIAGNYLNEPDRVKDSLSKISASGKYLLALINEVLDMSKIESGTISLNEDEFNLSKMIDELMTMIHPQIVRHKHELSLNIKELRHENVIGDSLRLQQVFLNILGNSVKYTHDGGKLSITVTEKATNAAKGACYEFVFKDNGIGMTADYLEHIFEPFTRAEDLRISKIQGTGLGMSIAQNIVRMMNGDIEVESEPGKGSTFTVTVFLKLQDRAAEVSKNIVSSSKDGHSELYDISSSDYSGSRVLLVEDNVLNLEIATEILKMAGLEVDEAENGKVAVEKFSASDENYYDMVFMDLQMPEMNGYEAARAIRALDRADAATVPIVAMTANAFAEDIKATREAGMNEHLAKPIDFAKLNDVMKKYLKAGEL